MAEVQVMRLSHKHREILEYLIHNPTERLGDVAARFGMTQAWLSTLIHSDVFQDALGLAQKEVYLPARVSIRERLTATAHMAIDKVQDELENMKPGVGVNGPLKVAESALDRLGYGTANMTSPVGPAVTISIESGVLAEARANFGRKVPSREEIENAEEVDTAPAEGVAASGDSD